MTSTVKKWITDRGYGFIVHPEGGRDLFVHFTDIVQAAGQPERTTLPVGAAVEFEIAPGKQGQVAKRVRLLPAYQPSTLNSQPT